MRFGRVVTLMLVLVATSDIAAGNVTLGTVKAAYRPATTAALPSYGKTSYLPYLQHDGALKANVVTAIASGSNIYMSGTYILPG